MTAPNPFLTNPQPTTVSEFQGSLIRRSDDSLTEDEDARLRSLLRACFPYEAKFYLKRTLQSTPPLYRWLASCENDSAPYVAHAALYEKIVDTEEGSIKIGAITEVCVSSHFRGRGLTRVLLEEIHLTLSERGVDFSMLFGRPEIYRSSGYRPIKNRVNATNAFLRHWNPFCGAPLVATLSQRVWPSGEINLRGPTF